MPCSARVSPFIIDEIAGSLKPTRPLTIAALRKKCRIPESIEICLPEVGMSLSNPPPGFVGVFCEQIRSAMSLPLHPFIQHALRYFEICPVQLHPNSYKSLIGSWVIWKEHGRTISWPEFLDYFSIRPCGVPGIYAFRAAKVNPVIDLPGKVHSWRHSVVFIPISSIGTAPSTFGDAMIRGLPRSKGTRDEALVALESFLRSVPVEDRRWPGIFGRTSVKSVTWGPEAWIDMPVRDSSTQRDRVHHSGCFEGDRGREGVGAPGPSEKRKGLEMATGTPSKRRREVERVTAMPPPAPQARGATVGAPVAGSSRTPVAQPDSLLSAFDKHVGPLLPGSAFEDVSSPSLQASLNPLLRDFILLTGRFSHIIKHFSASSIDMQRSDEMARDLKRLKARVDYLERSLNDREKELGDECDSLRQENNILRRRLREAEMNRGDMEAQIQESAERARKEALAEVHTQIERDVIDHYQRGALDAVKWIKTKFPDVTVSVETIIADLGKAPTRSP